MRSSETNQKYYHQTLSEKQTPSLITSGLVKGTTLTLGRRLSSRGTRVGVSFAPDGSIADEPREGYLF